MAIRNLFMFILQLWQYRHEISMYNAIKLRFILHFVKKNKICKVRIKSVPHPLYVRARSTDCTMVLSIFLDGGEYPIFNQYEPSFIIDAGANVGFTTVFFKLHYPKATIVAIEPDEDNCRMYELNTRGYSDVHLMKAGLGPDANHYLTIKDASVAPCAYQLQDTENGNGIPEITIPEICKQFDKNRIDILKLDIEGSESALFSRNAQWITSVENIFMELHEGAAPGASQKLLGVVKTDFILGFRGENLIFTREVRERKFRLSGGQER
jgi:FkbM family methyltransferase